jgi:UrcA family protein
MDTTTSPNRPLRISGVLTAGLAVIVSVWLTSVGTAIAQTAPDYKASEAIRYSDLDLSTANGARTLLHRIDLAARRVCGSEPSHSPLEPRSAAFYRQCVADSVDATVARIDAPLLTAMLGEQQPGGATLASR